MRLAKKKVLIFLALALFMAAFQPLALTQASSAYVVVNAYRLNVRSGPGLGHDVIGTVAGGTSMPVSMLSYDRDWYQVSSSAGTGWVSRHFAIDRGDWSVVPWQGRPANLGGGAAIPAGSPHVVVNTSYLNARTGPGIGHDVLTVLPGGSALLVTAIDNDGKWYQVATTAGAGWVNSNYTVIRGNLAGVPRTGGPMIVVPTAPPQPTVPAGAAHLVVNTSYLNVRSGPGIGHSVILTVPGGSVLQVLSIDVDGKWHEVMTSAGAGWVNSSYTVPRGNFSNVSRAQPPADPWAGPTPRAVVNTSYLNLRSSPGLGDNVITNVPGGTTLAVDGVSRDGKWFLVSGSFGQGWLRNAYVAFRGDYSRVPVV